MYPLSVNTDLLDRDSGIKEIDAESLTALHRGRYGDGAGGIAPQYVPPPLGSEVVGMDGEHMRLTITQLDGITDVTTLIDMQGWEGADLDSTITLLQVDVIVDIRCVADSIRRSAERLHHHHG